MGGEGDYISIYLSLHCHHQNAFCIKVGSEESHFNVSVGSDGQSHKTVSTNHNLFEGKGELKRYRTEVLLLTSLPPLPLGQTGSHITLESFTYLKNGLKKMLWTTALSLFMVSYCW